jgi:hypothetical protein
VQTATEQDVRTTEEAPPWRLCTRVAFRFCFVYLGLFCLVFAQITFAFAGPLARWLPEHAVLWQMVLLDPVTRWVGRTVFGTDAALSPDTGSGDQSAIWVLVFCVLLLALVATAVWSALDRHRLTYARLAAWFLVFLRMCLGGQMLFYGFAKVIPTQMPAPPLAALLERFGDLSPMAVLWLQVGSSHPYEIALGSVEVAAGLLLFLPRTATLGSLLSLASTAQIFLLNMTFDVPVKILSFHLLVMSAVLLAPQARRLADMLVFARPAPPATQAPLFASAARNRVAAAVQVTLGIWVLAGCVTLNAAQWNQYGGGRPKPELYGIWAVTDFGVDGTPRQPVTSDEFRWQRVVFDAPEVVTYQRMNGDLVDVAAVRSDDTLVLSDVATFTVDRQATDRLRLTGRLEGRPVSISLQRQSLDDFTLLNRGFHWVQEQPFLG